MTDYRVVPWTADRIDPLVALHHNAFGMDADMSRRYLQWKYFSNPWLDPTLFVALNHRDEIVGMRGFYGSCWRSGERTIVVPCADDFAIAESDRNSGLMTHIMRVAIDELTRRGQAQMLSLSGGHTALLQALAAGWVSIGSMHPVVRYSRTYHVRRRITARLPHRLVSQRLGDFTKLDRVRHDASADGISIASRPRAAEMTALAEARNHGARTRHVRDAAWWNWRFENPMREYRYLFHERNGMLNGYLVAHRTRIHEVSRAPYQIVDWEAESDEVRARMLSALIDRGRPAALGSWTGWMTEAEPRLLAQHGFVEFDSEQRARGLPCVLLKSLNPGANDVLSASGATWDIRQADSMHG